MRQGHQNNQNNRRGRGRGGGHQSNNNMGGGGGRKGGHNPLTRTYESSGPDVKIRGTAMQIADKYMNLARDAMSSGDLVMSENYLQHAEHYNRIIAAAQTAQQAEAGANQQPRQRRSEFDQPQIGADGQPMEGGEENSEGSNDEPMNELPSFLQPPSVQGRFQEQPRFNGGDGRHPRENRFRERQQFDRQGPRRQDRDRPEQGRQDQGRYEQNNFEGDRGNERIRDTAGDPRGQNFGEGGDVGGSEGRNVNAEHAVNAEPIERDRSPRRRRRPEHAGGVNADQRRYPRRDGDQSEGDGRRGDFEAGGGQPDIGVSVPGGQSNEPVD